MIYLPDVRSFASTCFEHAIVFREWVIIPRTRYDIYAAVVDNLQQLLRRLPLREVAQDLSLCRSLTQGTYARSCR